MAAHSLGVVAHGVRLAGFLLNREREILGRKKDGAEYKKRLEPMEKKNSAAGTCAQADDRLLPAHVAVYG